MDIWGRVIRILGDGSMYFAFASLFVNDKILTFHRRVTVKFSLLAPQCVLLLVMYTSMDPSQCRLCITTGNGKAYEKQN